MHPLSEALASRFISDFWAADHEVRWTAIEQERAIKLDDHTILMGRIDGQGISGDEPFFAEFKTLSSWKAGRNNSRMGEVKASWRMDPQALTYGVLLPDVHRFTVRWAIKGEQPTTDFEWYRYSVEETDFWREELKRIATDIRRRRGGTMLPPTIPWRTNLKSCLRYGIKYTCPFYHGGCTKLDFTTPPAVGQPRVSHLALERELVEAGATVDPMLVVLDATRVGTWLECEEKYRRQYEGGGWTEEGESLTIGSDFHALVGAHLTNIMKEQEKQNG